MDVHAAAASRSAAEPNRFMTPSHKLNVLVGRAFETDESAIRAPRGSRPSLADWRGSSSPHAGLLGLSLNRGVITEDGYGCPEIPSCAELRWSMRDLESMAVTRQESSGALHGEETFSDRDHGTHSMPCRRFRAPRAHQKRAPRTT